MGVKMRGQIIVAATNFVQRGGLSSAVKLRPNDGWMYASTSRNFVTSSIRLDDKDDKVSDQANLAKKVDPKDAAAKKAAEEATKRALEKKKLEDAKLAKQQAEEAAATKKAAEEAAAKKKAAEEAAAKQKAAEEAAAKKAAEAAAAKKAAEEAAAAKKAAEEAAAKKAAEAAAAAKQAEDIAIANMKDPIQELFLTSIRAYSTSGGLENADQATKAAVQTELARVAKQFGGAEGEDMASFPDLKFTDPEVDSINISK